MLKAEQKRRHAYLQAQKAFPSVSTIYDVSCFQQKLGGIQQSKRKKQTQKLHEEIRQPSEADSEMMWMLELSDKDFKLMMVNN